MKEPLTSVTKENGLFEATTPKQTYRARWIELATGQRGNPRKLGVSRYHIEPNDKCISCYECSRHCLVGIDVMSYAMKQETLDNSNSSCIGCGVCVTVCPMDVLVFEPKPKQLAAS